MSFCLHLKMFSLRPGNQSRETVPRKLFPKCSQICTQGAGVVTRDHEVTGNQSAKGELIAHKKQCRRCKAC